MRLEEQARDLLVAEQQMVERHLLTILLRREPVGDAIDQFREYKGGIRKLEIPSTTIASFVRE